MSGSSKEKITAEVLEEALRLAERLICLPPVATSVLLHLASNEERRVELGSVRSAILALLDSSPILLTVLGLDQERLEALLEAIEALVRASSRVVGLVRALSGEGVRVREAERQIRRALAAASRGSGGGSGWWEWKWVEAKGRRYGPYLYRRWRDGRRKRSRYEGKGGA